MNLEYINLKSERQIEEVKEFLKTLDLEYEVGMDSTIVVKNSNCEIVATASKNKKVIKCFGIDISMRGEGLGNIMLTELINKSFQEGNCHNFLFTKPSNLEIFLGIGFKLISKTDKVAFLEMGIQSIHKTIKKIKEEYLDNFNAEREEKSKVEQEEKPRSMIVMNCNPFTLGHLFLIEEASKNSKEVLIFIVEEDKSIFPFKIRYDLVKEGTKHLKNVVVIPGTEYIISAATFPNYFLKKEDDVLLEYIKLDVTVTAEHFCKELGITRRYIGEEPYCQMTKKYNETMKEILRGKLIEVVEIPRKEKNSKAISASEVRNMMKEDKEELLKEVVPKTTYDFIMSEKGRGIREKIRSLNSFS